MTSNLKRGLVGGLATASIVAGVALVGEFSVEKPKKVVPPVAEIRSENWPALTTTIPPPPPVTSAEEPEPSVVIVEREPAPVLPPPPSPSPEVPQEASEDIQDESGGEQAPVEEPQEICVPKPPQGPEDTVPEMYCYTP